MVTKLGRLSTLRLRGTSATLEGALSKLAKMLEVKSTMEVEPLRGKTILDEVEKAYALELPIPRGPTKGFLRIGGTFSDYIHLLSKEISGRPSYEQFLELASEVLKRQVGTWEAWARKSDWRLLMVYTNFLDIVGHAPETDLSNQWEAYALVAEGVECVKRAIPSGDSLCLIVSDHGLRNRDHTPDAFYSLSHPLGLSNPKMTDFYRLILKVVNPLQGY